MTVARRRWTAAERRRALRMRHELRMTDADIGVALGRSARSVMEQLGRARGISACARLAAYPVAYPPEVAMDAAALLRREIEAAKREAPTAPLYRGGW